MNGHPRVNYCRQCKSALHSQITTQRDGESWRRAGGGCNLARVVICRIFFRKNRAFILRKANIFSVDTQIISPQWHTSNTSSLTLISYISWNGRLLSHLEHMTEVVSAFFYLLPPFRPSPAIFWPANILVQAGRLLTPIHNGHRFSNFFSSRPKIRITPHPASLTIKITHEIGYNDNKWFKFSLYRRLPKKTLNYIFRSWICLASPNLKIPCLNQISLQWKIHQ